MVIWWTSILKKLGLVLNKKLRGFLKKDLSGYLRKDIIEKLILEKVLSIGHNIRLRSLLLTKYFRKPARPGNLGFKFLLNQLIGDDKFIWRGILLLRLVPRLTLRSSVKFRYFSETGVGRQGFENPVCGNTAPLCTILGRSYTNQSDDRKTIRNIKLCRLTDQCMFP